uniref:cytochrome c heme attachment protein n=1 Tax=Solanum aureum TaxID=2801088 RepID=UPI001FCD1AEE|nr:cytochrome c heme attachment protein [Solanum aureum]UNZ92712.1 cytochrome c heme attachment protein [Solanum aureum]
MIFSTLEHILTHISFSIVSIVITIHLITFLVDEIVKLYDSSEKGIIVTFFCITGLLVTRWISSGHFPLSDLYESLIFLSWSFSLIHIIPYFKKNVLILSKITGPSAILTQGFATSGILTEIHQSGILVPALQSEWLIMHVSMMLLGYAALLCGSLLSVALLVNEAWGSYWNWDPKETWAFITWIVFAIYLHTRTNRNLRGANSAIVASIGFLIIWICYFGVNLLGIGLHSYGSFPSTFN